MKKYFIETFVTCEDGREFHEMYECEGYERTSNWTGECIRCEDVNSFKNGKKQPIRKQFSKGKYITIEKMPHWLKFEVTIFENGTDNVVERWSA